jgi:class 3 adenylate cyclase/tetratricopeptide (TPR) repeat protein
MIRCASCGEENPERARFCLNCGSGLTAAPPAVEVRKTVTILFADVVGSTSLGERTDPESTRRMLSRYFDAMRAVIERHGGSVEKFIGDAVMAVFGIPVLHEDDAVRAVRAAHEMRSSVSLLNQELASASWSPISLRIGVNTGEVVAGEASQGHTMVTGDAVNVAARLEQAAGADEILLGQTTHRLVRAVVEAEAVEPLTLKGKTEPMPAFRLVSVGEQGPMRRHDTPLVGRRRELQLLSEAFDRANEEQACYLFTLLGTAGVGKSRLVHEFLGQMHERAQVLRARCLPYGEGITFWPVIELVQAAAGIELNESPASAVGKLRTLLEQTPDRDPILDRVCPTIGLSDEVVTNEEAFWGARKFLEAIASKKPLIVVIDDLHWAEPTMLDLIEHIADWSREAPILLLAIARPELLDVRPHWGGGKLNATTILLQPLSGEDSTELIANLIADAELAAQLQERIGETAEGNPLFVEELVAMLVDQDVIGRDAGAWRATTDLGSISVPPSISALVAARLDHLEPPERDLIGRASVVGKIFQRSAVAELSPPERRDELGTRLMTLVRKELVRPDRSTTMADEAFRFRHLLVRDAAYASLTKEQRADLHARFADWLERIAADRLVEYEEVIAYHQEQAYRYRSELGLTDELTGTLRDRAMAHLLAAGRRALARIDAHAAANLLTRAASLTSDDRTRAELLLDTAVSWGVVGDIPSANRIFGEAAEAAAKSADELLKVRAELERLDLEMLTNPAVDEGRVLELVDQLASLAEDRNDNRARAEAEMVRGNLFLNQCRWMESLEAAERARGLITQDDDPLGWGFITAHIWNALRWGPIPADQAIARIESDVAGSDGRDEPRLGFTGPLLAMQGRFDEARARAEAARQFFVERGAPMRIGGWALGMGTIEMIAGDLEGAERELTAGIDILVGLGETGVVSTLAGMRAEVRYRTGRRAEMEADIRLAQETGAPADISTQAIWRWVAAMAAADDGRMEEARLRIDEAIQLLEPTDFLEMRASAFEALAHVNARDGNPDAWRAALERALAEHERKANMVGARRVRGMLERGPA